MPTADRQKATVRVRIDFDALDPRILPDMGVQVSFLDAPAAADADAPPPRVRRLVPASAVVQREGTSVVFVLHDDAVERRAISAGRAIRDEVEIESGLDDGEQVVVAPPTELVDGARVKVH